MDVLSFQDFKTPVEHLHHWHHESGMPVLWADGARQVNRTDTQRINDGSWYAEQLAGLRENPGCVGAHLCGAFLRNRTRRRGLLDEQENPDTENIDMIRKANLDTEAWARSS